MPWHGLCGSQSWPALRGSPRHAKPGRDSEWELEPTAPKCLPLIGFFPHQPLSASHARRTANITVASKFHAPPERQAARRLRDSGYPFVQAIASHEQQPETVLLNSLVPSIVSSLTCCAVSLVSFFFSLPSLASLISLVFIVSCLYCQTLAIFTPHRHAPASPRLQGCWSLPCICMRPSLHTRVAKNTQALQQTILICRRQLDDPEKARPSTPLPWLRPLWLISGWPTGREGLSGLRADPYCVTPTVTNSESTEDVLRGLHDLHCMSFVLRMASGIKFNTKFVTSRR